MNDKEFIEKCIAVRIALGNIKRWEQIAILEVVKLSLANHVYNTCFDASEDESAASITVEQEITTMETCEQPDDLSAFWHREVVGMERDRRMLDAEWRREHT